MEDLSVTTPPIRPFRLRGCFCCFCRCRPITGSLRSPRIDYLRATLYSDVRLSPGSRPGTISSMPHKGYGHQGLSVAAAFYKTRQKRKPLQLPRRPSETFRRGLSEFPGLADLELHNRRRPAPAGIALPLTDFRRVKQPCQRDTMLQTEAEHVQFPGYDINLVFPGNVLKLVELGVFLIHFKFFYKQWF